MDPRFTNFDVRTGRTNRLVNELRSPLIRDIQNRMNPAEFGFRLDARGSIENPEHIDNMVRLAFQLASVNEEEAETILGQLTTADSELLRHVLGGIVGIETNRVPTDQRRLLAGLRASLGNRYWRQQDDSDDDEEGDDGPDAARVRRPQPADNYQAENYQAGNHEADPPLAHELPWLHRNSPDNITSVEELFDHASREYGSPPSSWRRRAQEQAPSVTVFGAGIAGLTAAHELIERGFDVQVVEKNRSLDDPSECEVGGLAATQYGRIRETRKLHSYLFPKDAHLYPEIQEWDDYSESELGEVLDEIGLQSTHWLSTQAREEDLLASEYNDQKDWARRLVLLIRRLPFRRVQRRFNFSSRIRFEPGSYSNILEEDKHLLQQLAVEVIKAFAGYREDFNYDVRLVRPWLNAQDATDNDHTPYGIDESNEAVDELIEQNVLSETVIRETLVLEIRGHTHRNEANARHLAKFRAMVIKAHLVHIIESLLSDAAGQSSISADLTFAKFLFKQEFDPAEESKQTETQTDQTDPPQEEDPADEKETKPTRLERLLAYLGHGSSKSGRAEQSIANYLNIVSVGDEEPLGDQKFKRDRDRSDRVDFKVIEHVMPGEHGFRFFPSFYRHLFDVMKRTPLLDPNGEETYRTAFDQLKPPPPGAIGFEDDDKAPEPFPRGRVSSVAELRQRLNLMRKQIGITNRDFMRASTQMLKYMTSSRERRDLYSEMSFLQFIDGESELSPASPESKLNVFQPEKRTTDYSEKAEKLIRELPQLLVAMSAEESDAHTNLIVSVQLLLDLLTSEQEMDKSLIGPTSDAWLRPWKAYLKRQGVRFYTGELRELVHNNQEILPIARPVTIGEPPQGSLPRPELGTADFEPESDFYIIALPFDGVCKVLSNTDDAVLDNISKSKNDLGQFIQFANEAGFELEKNEDVLGSKYRDKATGRPLEPFKYPMRDLVGIQYFFRHHVQFGDGHVNYLSSPWNLSSISQVFHWRKRPSRTLGFLGQLSVDIGDMYTKAKVLPEFPFALGAPFLEDKEAWNCNSLQIAEACWRQIINTAEPQYASKLQMPNYYHLDHSLKYDQSHGLTEARLTRNEAPLLINLPKMWKYRPGLDKTETSISYSPANRRWLMAGSYMATHTRLTTMEASCESAKLAVNAILRALADDAQGFYSGSGRLVGDYCKIWDPYEFEIRDLDYLRKVDETLMERNAPHLFDLLGVLDNIDLIPKESEADRRAEHLRVALNKTAELNQQAAFELGGDHVNRAMSLLDSVLGAGLRETLKEGKELRDHLKQAFSPIKDSD